VGALLDVVFHHVCVSGLDKNLLAVSHSLQYFFVVLFLAHDGFLFLVLQALLSYLDLGDIVLPKFAKFLLEHEFVVLSPHVIFDLFLTALQFQHDLLVPSLDRLGVVALA
jgi:hypothetical protein